MAEYKRIVKHRNIKKVSLVFLSDPGHGWLKVPKKIIRAAEKNEPRFIQSLTSFSYERNKHVYLEEDCDAAKLLALLSKYGVQVSIKYKDSNKSSKIRSYNRYNPNCVYVERLK